MNRQPALGGELVEVRALVDDDFAELYAVAADRLLWEQHDALGVIPAPKLIRSSCDRGESVACAS